MTDSRFRGRLGVLVLLALAAPLASGALVGVPATETATPAYNLFTNSEMEVCAPAAVGSHRLAPDPLQARVSCPPWLLRGTVPNENGYTPRSSSTAVTPGHGGTTSARIVYDARDGVVIFGQRLATEDPGVALWRSPTQVVFDARANGPIVLGFHADAIDAQGRHVPVPAARTPLVIPGDRAWHRYSLSFDQETGPVTALWFEIQGGSPSLASLDLDNVYAISVYLRPHVDLP